MPVSESEKLGVYVPGYHFSEKAEHIPIKKRRILFRASSPPLDTTNPQPEGAERHETSPDLNPNSGSVPATHEADSGICESGSEGHTPVKKELVKEDDVSGRSILSAAAACSNSLVAEADRCEGLGMVSSVTKTPEVPKGVEFKKELVKESDFSGTSILSAAAACSISLVAEADRCEGSGMVSSVAKTLEVPKGVEFKKELVKESDFSGTSILSAAAACSNSLVAEADQCEGSGMVFSVTKTPEVPKGVEFNENNVKKEPNSHTLTPPSKVNETKLNNSSSHVPLKLAFSITNQEPSIQNPPAQDVKFSWDLNTVMDACEELFVSEHDISNDKAAHVEQKKNDYTEANSEIPSKSIINENLPVEWNSLTHENRELMMEKREPLSDKIDSAQYAVVVKTETLDDNHTDCTSNAISVSKTLSLENPTHGNISKYMNLSGESLSKSIINRNLPVELNSLAYANKEIKMEKCEKPSPEFDSAQHVVVKTEPLHDNHTVSAIDVIPVTTTLSLENPTHGIFPNYANLCGQSSGGDSTQAVDTKLSIDCSIPPDTQTVMAKYDLSLNTATCEENGPHLSGVSSNKVEHENIKKMELTSSMIGIKGLVNKDETDKVGPKVVMEGQPASVCSMHDATQYGADNCSRYYTSQSYTKAGSGMAKLDENLVGYESQYEDGELREWGINAWKGYELNEGENESDMNRESGLDMSISDAHETNSQHGQEGSSGTTKLTEVGSGKEADVTSSVVVLPGKLHSGNDVLSGPEPNELTSGQEKSERQDYMEQHASQSDKWKMNVSGRELLPENQRIHSNNFSKTQNFPGRKFSYREEQKDRFDTEDVKTKAESPRLYRKESLTRIGGPSARDGFLTRGRLQMQGCSHEEGDSLTFRPERESGALRSFGRGRYAPHNRPSVREDGMWSRSLERGRDLKRLPSPSYQGDTSFHRSILEDSGTVDPSDVGGHTISSYISRRPFRSRSPATREVNDFRARLGLRPTEDTGHDKFMNLNRGRGRGRSMRYDTRLDREGPRGRYHGPTNDDCDVLMTEYSHPFPRRRRCFSPIERGTANSYQHHQSGSRSPPRPRTRSPIGNSSFRRRSRSPGFRPDARIPRPISPGYRDRSTEYISGPRNNNSSPPSSRWVSFKERPVFNRSPPPGRTDGSQVERFSFYDSSRKPKQTEYYRSGNPGKFSDLNEGGRGRPRFMDNDGDRLTNGYRRGGFVRRYNMDETAKRFQYDGEDRCSRGFDSHDRPALEDHAPSSLKPCSDGTHSRFRDLNTLQ